MEITPLPDWESEPTPPAGLEIIKYSVMLDPPSESGAVKVSVAVFAPVEFAAPTVGAPGITGDVVIELEAADAPEVPAPFKALTVKV